MSHYTTPEFWAAYNSLPATAQRIADRAFALLKADPRHPSLHLKRTGGYWSARAGLHYRSLGVDVEDGILWFWIGTHAQYDDLLR